MLQESWWGVVEAMSNFVACGFEIADLELEWVRHALEAQGFSQKDIDKAFGWLENASLTGNIGDVFSMFQPAAEGTRIATPLERASICDQIWGQVQHMRNKGIISQDTAERVLEGMRVLDTRDWEEDDVETFMEDVLNSSLPSTSPKLRKRLSRKGASLREFYS